MHQDGWRRCPRDRPDRFGREVPPSPPLSEKQAVGDHYCTAAEPSFVKIEKALLAPRRLPTSFSCKMIVRTRECLATGHIAEESKHRSLLPYGRSSVQHNAACLRGESFFRALLSSYGCDSSSFEVENPLAREATRGFQLPARPMGSPLAGARRTRRLAVSAARNGADTVLVER